MAQNQIAYPVTYPRKNKFLNGEFIIAQRGPTFTFAPISDPVFRSGYTLDRFYFTGSNFTGTRTPQTKVTQESFIQGSSGISGEPSKYLRVNFIDAGASLSPNSYVAMDHYFDDSKSLLGQTVTLSFYAKTSIPNRKLGIKMMVVGKDIANNFAIGDVFKKAIKTTTSWSRIIHTFTIPSSFANFSVIDLLDFQMMFQCGAAKGTYWNTDATPAIAGETIDIADLKLEVGNNATPLVRKNYLEELLECQRYYWSIPDGYAIIGYNEANAAQGIASFVVKFPVAMIKTPSVTNSEKLYLHLPMVDIGDKAFAGIRTLSPENCQFCIASSKPNLSAAEIRIFKSSGHYLSFSAE